MEIDAEKLYAQVPDIEVPTQLLPSYPDGEYMRSMAYCTIIAQIAPSSICAQCTSLNSSVDNDANQSLQYSRLHLLRK